MWLCFLRWKMGFLSVLHLVVQTWGQYLPWSWQLELSTFGIVGYHTPGCPVAAGRPFTLVATIFRRGRAGWALRLFELSWLGNIVFAETLSKEGYFSICHDKIQEQFFKCSCFPKGRLCFREAEKVPFFETHQTRVKAEVHLGDVFSSVGHRCFALKWHVLHLVSCGLLSCVLKHSPNCLGSPATKIHEQRQKFLASPARMKKAKGLVKGRGESSRGDFAGRWLRWNL